MISIREHMLDVDVLTELERYYGWQQKSIRGGKLLACSPFRNERHPSFACRLDNGVWIDSGSSSDDWKKGGFVRLISFLRQEQEEETEDYLIAAYGLSLADVDSLSLDICLQFETKEAPRVLPPDTLRPFLFRHPYLGTRGIDEQTQRLFRIGYDKRSRSVSMPWMNKAGILVNVKFRSVTDKRFWYISGGDRIRNHVYGLHIVTARQLRRVYVTESETDALYLWSNGFPAVALGGANLTRRQRELFLLSPIRELIVATDNDEAGHKIARTIFDELGGFMDVRRMEIPSGRKDVNDLTPETLAEVAREPREFTNFFDYLERV